MKGFVKHRGEEIKVEIAFHDGKVIVYLPDDIEYTNLIHMIEFGDLDKLPSIYKQYELSDEKIAWLESIKAKPFDNPMICSFPIEILGEIHMDLYSGEYLAITPLEELKRKYAQRVQTV